FGAQRPEYVGVDQAACAAAAHGCNDQEVGPRGQVGQRGFVAVGNVAALAAVVIADFHVETRCALRDGHAYTAQAHDTQFLVAYAGSQWKRVISAPEVGPYIPFGVSELAR